MLKMRIIPCLDVRDDVVVKGILFKDHEFMGEIEFMADQYCRAGADEIVFYDITASSERRLVNCAWINRVAAQINIPFCVAGGIRSVADAELVFENGADKISINSPALQNPTLITDLANRFGSQSIVVGIDSWFHNGEYHVYQYTGSQQTIQKTGRRTLDWAMEAEDRGAGEIVVNCMNQDGVRRGYDIVQLSVLSSRLNIPVIASGGAGHELHFRQLFELTSVTGALAASVFHQGLINIQSLKKFLSDHQIQVRI